MKEYMYNLNYDFLEKDLLNDLRPNEARVIQLIEVFDMTVSQVLRAKSHIDTFYNKYLKGDDFNDLFEITYHLNFCIRLLSTCDDVMKRIVVEIHRKTTGNTQNRMKNINDYNNYLKSNKDDEYLSKLKLKFGINKNTKKYRHIYTHEGAILIVEIVIEKQGNSTWFNIDPEKIKEKQLKILDDLLLAIQKDIDNIRKYLVHNRNEIDSFNKSINLFKYRS